MKGLTRETKKELRDKQYINSLKVSLCSYLSLNWSWLTSITLECLAFDCSSSPGSFKADELQPTSTPFSLALPPVRIEITCLLDILTIFLVRNEYISI